MYDSEWLDGETAIFNCQFIFRGKGVEPVLLLEGKGAIPVPAVPGRIIFSLCFGGEGIGGVVVEGQLVRQYDTIWVSREDGFTIDETRST